MKLYQLTDNLNQLVEQLKLSLLLEEKYLTFSLKTQSRLRKVRL